VFHSKAVGEPPLMLAISVWSAMRDAISSLSDYRYSPPLDTPATPEHVLSAITATKRWVETQNAVGQGQTIQETPVCGDV
jgi:xanthine dehydrogenase large subunit